VNFFDIHCEAVAADVRDSFSSCLISWPVSSLCPQSELSPFIRPRIISIPEKSNFQSVTSLLEHQFS